MTEPKRRGRPPKASIEGADVALARAEIIQSVEVMATGSSAVNPAQVYADRVWAGQSESLSRHERLGRVAAALEAQGLSMEGVQL